MTTAQIDTVLKQQVERIECHPRHVRPVPPHFSVKGKEIGSPAGIANAQFAVQDGRRCRKLLEGHSQAGKATRPLGAASRKQPDATGNLWLRGSLISIAD